MGGLLRNVSVNEAIGCFARIEPVRPKRLTLAAATGLRLAEDVTVRRPQPVEPFAARNGYAVAAASTIGASPRRPRPLEPEAVPVDTGSPLPPGTDAVLPFRSVAMRSRGPVAIRPVRSGEGVVAPESLAEPGQRLASAGTRMTFALAVSCAACGITDVLVRRPVVDIIFNSPVVQTPSEEWVALICSSIRGSGSELGAVSSTGGDRAALAAALLGSSGDVITIVGGVGDGPGDCTMAAVADVGEAVFHGVRMTPGGAMGFGFVGGKPIFASPGGLGDMIAANIVLSWHFARRVFARPSREPDILHAPLAEPIPASPDRSRLVVARLESGRVTPFLDDKPSARVLAHANCSIFVPEGARHRRRGQIVPVLKMGVAM